MNVLITGGTGSIGSRLVVPLVRRGDRVVVFDVRSMPHLRTPEFSEVTIVKGNLADRYAVTQAVRSSKIDSIFHLGALLSSAAETHPHEAWQANMDGMVNVLEAARLGGAGKVVFSSSVAAFGKHLSSPVTIDSPQWPVSLYGVTKVAGERLGVYYGVRFGLDFRSIRIPAVIAPHGAAGGTSAYCSAVFEQSVRIGNYNFYVRPSTRAPMLYIDDAVRALLDLHEASNRALTRRVYNVAGIAPSAQELAKAIQKRLPQICITYTPDPLRTSIVESWPWTIDDSEARKDWNWKPMWDLEMITNEVIALLTKDPQIQTPRSTRRSRKKPVTTTI